MDLDAVICLLWFQHCQPLKAVDEVAGYGCVLCLRRGLQGLEVGDRVLKWRGAEVELAPLCVGDADGWEVGQVGLHGTNIGECDAQGDPVTVKRSLSLVQVDATADDITRRPRLTC